MGLHSIKVCRNTTSRGFQSSTAEEKSVNCLGPNSVPVTKTLRGSMLSALSNPSKSQSLGLVAHTYHLSNWDVEAGGSRIQGYPEFILNLDPAWVNMRSCPKNKTKKVNPRV